MLLKIKKTIQYCCLNQLKTIIPILLLVLGCCNKPIIDPGSIIFLFNIVDENEMDLFFEDSSLFEPDDLIVSEIIDDTLINHSYSYDDNGPFEIRGFRVGINDSKSFLIEIGSERKDTLKFISSTSVENNPDGNRFDVYFNKDHICTDCNNNEIYKLTIHD
jgi:hypothetical protein